MLSSVDFKPELVAPAGNLEKLKTACLYGADALYLSGHRFGLRSGADNFSRDELTEGLTFAKSFGVKVYVAMNAYLHDSDLEGLEDEVRFYQDLGVSAVIASDPAVIRTVKENSSIPVHLSTQMSCINHSAAKFWKSIGVKRVVAGREISLAEAQSISTSAGLELEVFIHGAMCSSYSGQCTLSNYTAGRDSNRGGCKQSCRFEFEISTGASEKFLSSKDLLGIEFLPEFYQREVSAFKIEGRMKSCLYLATTVKAYASMIRMMVNKDTPVPAEVLSEARRGLERDLSHRGTCKGSLVEPAGSDSIQSQSDIGFMDQQAVFLGKILKKENGVLFIQLKNTLKVGDKIEIIHFRDSNSTLTIEKMFDVTGKELLGAKSCGVVKVPSEKGSVGEVVKRIV